MLEAVPQSRFVISGGIDCRVKITLVDGDVLALAKEHNGAVTGLSYSSEKFVSVGHDGHVLVWSVLRAVPVKRYHSADKLLGCRFLSADLFVTCGQDHLVRYYDLRQLNPGASFSHSVGSDNLNAIDYVGDAYTVGVGSSDGNYYSLDLRNAALTTHLFVNQHRGGVTDVRAFGTSVLLGFENGTRGLFNQNDFELDLPPTAPSSYRLTGCIFRGFHDDTVHILGGSSTTVLHHWTYSQRLDHTSVDIGSSVVNNVVFSKPANCVVASSGDGRLHFIDNFV